MDLEQNGRFSLCRVDGWFPYGEIDTPHEYGEKWIVGAKQFMLLMAHFEVRLGFYLMTVH